MSEQHHSEYVQSLDGLRGLAALVVVVTHATGVFVLSFEERLDLLESPWGPFLNGQGAVQLFFVLSGYVLAGSLGRNRSAVSLLQFYVKRIFRIHPPYVFGVLVAWCASFAYGTWGDAELSEWLRTFAGTHLTPDQLLGSFAFPGNAFGQLPVGWTLAVEMIFSFLLPVMLLIARRTHWLALVMLCVVTVLMDPGLVYLRYAIDFALGVAAHMERVRLRRWVACLSRPQGAVAVALAISIFNAPLSLGWFRTGPVSGEARTLLMMGFGGVSLLVLAAHLPWFSRWLAARPVAYLGRISYSLYLCHFPIVILAGGLVGGPPSWSRVSSIAGIAAVSVAFAALGHRLIERPSIRVGNRICAQLSSLLGGEVVASARGDQPAYK